jgi:hypothetical protein
LIANGETGWVECPFWQKANTGWRETAQIQFPGIWKYKAHHQSQKRGLAGSIWSQEAKHGAIRNLQRQRIQGQR